jgi:hypothetical protein
VKWGGVAASILLIAALIGSGWGQVQWTSQNGRWVGLSTGRFNIGGTSFGQNASNAGFRFYGFDRYRLEWWFYSHNWYVAWQFSMPLWPPIGLSVLATLLAFRLDHPARRRTSINHCPTCNYDLRGLPAATPCPECGALPEQARSGVAAELCRKSPTV